jgi:hypothetical protein
MVVNYEWAVDVDIVELAQRGWLKEVGIGAGELDMYI